MPKNTPNLNLYKKDPQTDGDDTFNIETMLNENFDKIDAAAGDQTIVDTQVPTGNIGSTKTLLGWLAYMIKSITGKSSWRTAPATTLEAAKTHADDTIRHLTAAERTSWNAKETTSGAQSKADAAKTAAAADATTKANAAQAAAALDATTKANAVQTNLTAHAGNTTVHITAAERAGWNAKETPGGAQAKADAAQSAAIAYTDTKVDRVDLTQTLGPGTSVVTADGNGSELDLTVYGQTLVNLLGSMGNFEVDSNGDGRADGLSMGMPATYSRVAGKYGTFAQRVASSASETSTDRRVSRLSIAAPAGKYVLISDGMTDGTNGRMGFSVYNNGLSVTSNNGASSSVWKPVFLKFTLAADTQRLDVHMYNTATAGTVGWAQYDGVGLYQVDDALYARIGVDIIESNIRDYLPHVDGKQHVQGVAVTKQGKNLFLPITQKGTNSNGTPRESYIFDHQATVAFGNAYVSYDVMPNTNYVFSAVMGATGQIGVYDETATLALADYANGTPRVFNSGSNSRVRLYFRNSVVGTVQFSNMQLEIGTVATPFTPAEPQSVILPVTLGQIGDIKDSVYSAGSEWMYVERVRKDIVLDGSLPWAFDVQMTGFKVVRLAKFSDAMALSESTSRAIRFDELCLQAYNAYATFANGYRQNSGDASFFVTLANADTGWVDGVGPSSNSVKALMNGWKAVSNNGTAYTAWVSILDGSAPTTNTEAWVSANKAPGWTAWATLDYALATPAAPVPVPNAEGSITLHPGGNQISVETGIVQREKVKPVYYSSAGRYYINAVDISSKTIYRVAKFLKVYKGSDDDTFKWTMNGAHSEVNKPIYGDVHAWTTTDYDPKADYYVTYITLDRYALTANVIETAATWRTGLGGVVSELVQSTSDLRQDNDRQDFADDYIEAKVDNLGMGIADASVLPDTIQKYKLTESGGWAKRYVGVLNSLTIPGYYFIPNTPTDAPTGYSAAGALEILRLADSTVNVIQRLTMFSDGRCWTRGGGNGGIWGVWVESENASRKNIAGGYAGLDTNGDLLLTAIPDAVLQGTVAYAVTTGTAPALAASITPSPAALSAGLRLSIKTHAATTGPVTLNLNGLGAKSIKKPNGNNPPLAQGGVYTLVYDGTNFTLQGEGGEYGTAGAAQVLSGYTVGTEQGVLNGAIPVYGAQALPNIGAAINGTTLFLNGPKGSYETSTAIAIDDPDFNAANIPEDINIFGLQGGIPRRGAYTNALSTGWDGNQVYIRIPGGVYQHNTGQGSPEIVLSAAQARADGNIIPSNIRAGTWVYGVEGTLIEGKRSYSGSGVASGYNSCVRADGSTVSRVEVYQYYASTGWTPSKVIVTWGTNGMTIFVRNSGGQDMIMRNDGGTSAVSYSSGYSVGSGGFLLSLEAPGGSSIAYNFTAYE